MTEPWTIHLPDDPAEWTALAVAQSGECLPWDPLTVLVLPGVPARLNGGSEGMARSQLHPACSPVPIPLDMPWRAPWLPGLWHCRTCGKGRGVAPRLGDGKAELVSLACWCRNIEVTRRRGQVVPEWKHLVGAWKVQEDGLLGKETYWYRQFARDFDPFAYANLRAFQNQRLAEVRANGLEPPLGPWPGIPYPEGPWQDVGTWLTGLGQNPGGQPVSPSGREPEA